MDFRFVNAPAGGAVPVRLPQPQPSLREVKLLGQAAKKAPAAQVEVRQGHRRAEQSRYKARCRMAMAF